MKPLLTEHDFVLAAQALGCEVAAIKAVAEVEAGGVGFHSTGEPKILFERHWFHRLTNGRFSAMAPDISNPKAGGYKGGLAEHERLSRAAKLDRNAAPLSASWGKFQIMGFNFKRAGFADLQSFINAMFRSEADHLRAFVSFIKADLRLVAALQANNFTRFASIYNGPGYAKNKYDHKMYAAYRRMRNG